MHDSLDSLGVSLREVKLLQRHEVDSLVEHPAIDQVFGDTLLCYDHAGKSTAGCLLQGHAEPLRLLDSKKCGKSAQDRCPVKATVGTIEVKLDEVAYVLELFMAELRLDLSLNHINFVFVILKHALNCGHSLLFKLCL